VAKLRRGEPLDDADRAPWIAKVRAEVERLLRPPGDGVVACSALKATDRASLLVDPARVRLVHLEGAPDLIAERLSTRGAHFMPAALLPTQFAALERPEDALAVDVRKTPREIVRDIRTSIGR
jgi:gluconokinase